MKDYAITYQVTVFTTGHDKKHAELKADMLINRADSGYADTTVCIDKMVKSKIAEEYM
jgi:hypothetical protein